MRRLLAHTLHTTETRLRGRVRARQAEPELSRVENFGQNKRLQTQARACVLSMLLAQDAGGNLTC
jgi:hypothetical protein